MAMTQNHRSWKQLARTIGLLKAEEERGKRREDI